MTINPFFKTCRTTMAVACLLGALGTYGARAQEPAVPPPSAPAQRSAAELDKLVEPIVAYPDYLVGVILPASVYPLEVGDAAFQLAQPNAAVDVSAQSWDPSVKSLAQFPVVVQWMDRNLPWTVELGRAVVAQQADVLEAIQRVRLRIYAAGTLRSDAFKTVTKASTASGKEIITIAPTLPGEPAASTTAATPPSQTSAPAPVATSASVPSTPTPHSTPPPAAVPPDSSGDAGSVGRLVVGVAATAAIVNNVDWDEKYIVDTPGGVVIIGEDDLEEFQDQRASIQSQGAAATTASQSRGTAKAGTTTASTAKQPNNRSGASTQPVRQPAATTQSPPKTAWQPDASRMASSGAPQSSAASKSPAARGWSQPATPSATTSARSSKGAPPSRSSGLGNLSEGSKARTYSGRGSASRSGGRFSGRRGR
jgi:hypothetical protein